MAGIFQNQYFVGLKEGNNIPLDLRPVISESVRGLESVTSPTVIPFAGTQLLPSKITGPSGLSQTIRPSESFETIIGIPFKTGIAEIKTKIKLPR